MIPVVQIVHSNAKCNSKFYFSFAVTCLLSIITTTLTAYQYGTAATANVLEILPRSKSLYLAIMLVTLQLCLSSAVGHSALFQHVEDWLKIPKGRTTTNIPRNLENHTEYSLIHSRVQLEAMHLTHLNNRSGRFDCGDFAKIRFSNGDHRGNTNRTIDIHFASASVQTNLSNGVKLRQAETKR